MAFAIDDIIFSEILGFTTYPGSPFTGNIFQDIILFFFVPTVFLIIFVYIVSGLVVPAAYGKLRLLMGLAIYAFILASRYYEGIAIFASQFYFVFILIIGFLYFFTRHFRRATPPGGGHMAYEGGGGRMAYEGGGSQHNFQDMSRSDLNLERERVTRMLRDLSKEIQDAERAHEPRLEGLRQQRIKLNDELREINHQLQFFGKSFRGFG